MRNDMYNTYDNCEFNYFYPISFERRNKDYLCTKEPAQVEWHYGDSVELTFNLIAKDDEGEILPNYFDGKEITVSFLNFRKEVIFDKTFVSNDITDEYTVVLPIDCETSKLKFDKGNYECTLVIKDVENNTQETVLDNYLIYVK